MKNTFALIMMLLIAGVNIQAQKAESFGVVAEVTMFISVELFSVKVQRLVHQVDIDGTVSESCLQDTSGH